MEKENNAILISIQNTLNGVATTVGVLQTHVAELKSDMIEVKSDIRELKSDVSTLKSDVAELKSDVSILKLDVSTLKTDVADLKVEVKVLNNNLDNLAASTARNFQRLEDSLNNKIEVNKSETNSKINSFYTMVDTVNENAGAMKARIFNLEEKVLANEL